MTACAVWLRRDFLIRHGRTPQEPPCTCPAEHCPPPTTGGNAMTFSGGSHPLDQQEITEPQAAEHWLKTELAKVTLERDRLFASAQISERQLDRLRRRVTSLDRLTDWLHVRRMHPDFEYATTDGPRKAWDGGQPPDGSGWEPNATSVRPDAWERFDYREERVWRRRSDQRLDSELADVEATGPEIVITRPEGEQLACGYRSPDQPQFACTLAVGHANVTSTATGILWNHGDPANGRHWPPRVCGEYGCTMPSVAADRCAEHQPASPSPEQKTETTS